MAQLLARTVRRYPLQPPLPNRAVIELLRPVQYTRKLFSLFFELISLVFFTRPQANQIQAPIALSLCPSMWLLAVGLSGQLDCEISNSYGGEKQRCIKRECAPPSMPFIHCLDELFAKKSWLFSTRSPWIGIDELSFNKVFLHRIRAVQGIVFLRLLYRVFFASSHSSSLFSETSTNSPQNIQTRNCEHFYLFCLQFLFYLFPVSYRRFSTIPTPHLQILIIRRLSLAPGPRSLDCEDTHCPREGSGRKESRRDAMIQLSAPPWCRQISKLREILTSLSFL